MLDAACGTGKYFGMVLDAGRRVVGTDQSTGMLARAWARFPAVPVERVGLQELAFDGEFDAVMCIDAMENVPPEDWPRVLGNLRRALAPGGHLYLTVEEVDHADLDRCWPTPPPRAAGGPGRGGRARAPATTTPSREQVGSWLEEGMLAVVAEEYSAGDGYGYLHLLVRPTG